MAEQYPEGYLPWLANYLDNWEEYLGLPVPQPVAQPQPAPQAPEHNTPSTTPAPIELVDIEWSPLSPWQVIEVQDTVPEPEGEIEQPIEGEVKQDVLVDQPPSLQAGPSDAALPLPMPVSQEEVTTGKFSIVIQ